MILRADARVLPLQAGSVDCVVTSPPYWGLRDYGTAGQVGLEATPEEYVAGMVGVFRELWRVLKDGGTCWLNLGDSYASANPVGNRTLTGKTGLNCFHDGYVPPYHAKDATTKGHRRSLAGLKPKDLVGIPWLVAFALQADGWWLRSDIVWAKPNPMPESVRDRPTRAHEYVFLMTKSERYYYDADAIAEPGVTAVKENYPSRARITGRGTQGAASARGNDRDKSGGFPPRKTDKQRGHSRRHAGFNDRWDQMERDERCSYLRNRRSVWTIGTQPFPGAHFAVMPERLAALCVLAGSPRGGVVLDPFAGAGTVGVVAARYGREFIGCDLKLDYCRMAKARIGSHEQQALFL